jgi:hypothetical protein
LAAALREGREEAGLNPDALRPRWWSIADHRGWAYTTVAAEVRTGAAALTGPTNWETADLQWVERGKVGEYNLHPGLAVAWPYLERLIGQRLTLVVDGANVVGSRPDGWWKDRFGAAIRLRDRLETLAAGGLANVESDHPNGWYPEVVMVVEGRARGIGQGQSVRVVDAPGEGDDEIVAVARAAAQAGRGPVAVATADRGLIARLRALPGDVAIMPPSRLVGK